MALDEPVALAWTGGSDYEYSIDECIYGLAIVFDDIADIELREVRRKLDGPVLCAAAMLAKRRARTMQRTLEATLEHVARARAITERVRHLGFVVVCSGGIDSRALSVVSERERRRKREKLYSTDHVTLALTDCRPQQIRLRRLTTSRPKCPGMLLVFCRFPDYAN